MECSLSIREHLSSIGMGIASLFVSSFFLCVPLFLHFFLSVFLLCIGIFSDLRMQEFTLSLSE